MSETYLQKGHAISRLRTGLTMTSDEIADNFALFDIEERANALYAFDRELAETTGDMTMTERANHMSLRRKLGTVHETLRRAGR